MNVTNLRGYVNRHMRQGHSMCVLASKSLNIDFEAYYWKVRFKLRFMQ